MNVLDVYLNGHKLCRAGVGTHGVLNATVSWFKLIGSSSRTARRFDQPAEDTRLDVGGLRDRFHRVWAERRLVPGDRVAIVVTSAKAADRPVRKEPQIRKATQPKATT